MSPSAPRAHRTLSPTRRVRGLFLPVLGFVDSKSGTYNEVSVQIYYKTVKGLYFVSVPICLCRHKSYLTSQRLGEDLNKL